MALTNKEEELKKYKSGEPIIEGLVGSGNILRGVGDIIASPFRKAEDIVKNYQAESVGLKRADPNLAINRGDISGNLSTGLSQVGSSVNRAFDNAGQMIGLPSEQDKEVLKQKLLSEGATPIVKDNIKTQVATPSQEVQQVKQQSLSIPDKSTYTTNPPRFETKPIEVVNEKKYVPQVTMSNYNTPTGKSSREIDGTMQSLGSLPQSIQKLNLVDNGRTSSYSNYQQNPYDFKIKSLSDQIDSNMMDQSMDTLVRGIKNRALRRNIESLSNAYRTNVTENLGLGDLQQRQLQNQRDYELRQRGQQLNEIKGLSDINLQSSQADKIGLDVQQARNLFEAQQVLANPDTDKNSIEYKKAKSLLDINYPVKNNQHETVHKFTDPQGKEMMYSTTRGAFDPTEEYNNKRINEYMKNNGIGDRKKAEISLYMRDNKGVTLEEATKKLGY